MKPNLRRTAVVHYLTEEGQPATWSIACSEKDDDRSIKRHIERFRPWCNVQRIEFDEGDS